MLIRVPAQRPMIFSVCLRNRRVINTGNAALQIIMPLFLHCLPHAGICISSDTSSVPPISRNGHALASDKADCMESASTIVNPDMVDLPPVVTSPFDRMVLVFFSGLAGLTAALPSADNQLLYFAKCCLPCSGLDG